MFHMIVMANLSNIKNSDINSNTKNNNRNLIKRSESTEREDLVARWVIPLCDKDHIVEFEHGTTSGKRVITVDGKEILRRDWMFRLVGDEYFNLTPKHSCMIRVNPKPAFNYSYLLYIDGLELEEFLQKQRTIMCLWNIMKNKNEKYRIALDKLCLNIWVNGEIIVTDDEFIEDGTKMNFKIKDDELFIIGTPSGNKKNYINYELYYNDVKIEESKLN